MLNWTITGWSLLQAALTLTFSLSKCSTPFFNGSFQDQPLCGRQCPFLSPCRRKFQLSSTAEPRLGIGSLKKGFCAYDTDLEETEVDGWTWDTGSLTSLPCSTGQSFYLTRNEHNLVGEISKQWVLKKTLIPAKRLKGGDLVRRYEITARKESSRLLRIGTLA